MTRKIITKKWVSGMAIAATLPLIAGCVVTRTREEPVSIAEQAARVEAPKPLAQDILRETGSVFYFDTGSADLEPEAKIALSKLGDFLSLNPQETIRIEGYTDNVGEEEFNQDLSNRRVDVIRGILLERGATPEQIKTLGFGEASPIADNSTEEGRAANRRAEIVVSQVG